jgi:hypothetical protein
VRRWERWNLDLPDDFPIEALDSLHRYPSDRDPARDSFERKEWTNGLNGLVYRFRACDEHLTQLAESLERSNSPPQPERFRQEKWFFAVYSEGLSAFECFAYGLYYLGSLANPAAFEPSTNPRSINPRMVAGRYARIYPGDDLTAELGMLTSSAEYEEWSVVRHLLNHRGAPGRHFSLSTGSAETASAARWGIGIGDEASFLDPAELENRRRWFGDRIIAIAKAADAFARARIT